MKGVICYYSATGNTKLVVDHLASKLGVEFDLCNIAKDPKPDFSKYAVAGFASPVDWLAEPELMRRFLSELPSVKDMPAFLIATNGGLAGRILARMRKAVMKKGFRIIAAHAIRMPDSYPPLLATGRYDLTKAPGKRDLERFGKFVSDLKASLKDISAGKRVKEACLRPNMLGAIAGHFGRDKSKKTQGPKSVDEKLCTKCRKCEKGCPYSAIRLDPFPVFDESKCYGCWACYNRCPEKAIFTKKLRGNGQYPGPSEELRRKLSA